MHVILRAAAPAEAAAEIVPVYLAFRERYAGGFDKAANEASRFCVGTQTSALSAESFTVAFITSMQACERNGVE